MALFVSEHSQKIVALGRYWAKTFAERLIDLTRAHRYLQRFPTDFHFSELPTTIPDSISQYISHIYTPNWPQWYPLHGVQKMASMHASSVLSVTSQRAQAGFSFSHGFNDREAIFPPKGSKSGDSQEVVSTPAETRPLKCKNNGNKILAG